MIEYDRKLESPRAGHYVQAFGWVCIVAAVTIAVMNAITGFYAIMPVNLITFGLGVYNIHLGRKSARHAVEHHQRMEGMRQSIDLSSPAGVKTQFAIWGYAITGDITERSAVISEQSKGARPLHAREAWDYRRGWLRGQLISHGDEASRQVKDWAAFAVGR